MPRNTDVLIRLAQIFDACGLYSTADIIDSRIQLAAHLRMAINKYPFADDFKHLKFKNDDDALEDIRNKMYQAWDYYYGITPHSEPLRYGRESSWWIMPDGSRIDLGSTHHGDAFYNLMEMYDFRSHPAHRDFTSKRGSYQCMGENYGAIRVFKDTDLYVTAYTVPTQAQISTITDIAHQVSPKEIEIEQYLDTGADEPSYFNFKSLDEWKSAITKPQYQQTDFAKTKNGLENQDAVNPSWWKALEKRRLEEEYPGETLAPLRKMYERSASNDSEVPDDADIQPMKDTLMRGFSQVFSLVPPETEVKHSIGTMKDGYQSFWVLPDGTRIELGRMHHFAAVPRVAEHLGVENDKTYLYMRSGGDYYGMMGNFFGAVRVHAVDDMLACSAYAKPTKEQVNAVRAIFNGLHLTKFQISQVMTPGEWPKLFKSIDEWENATINKKYQRLQPEDNSYDIPLWKVVQRQRLEEEYPGEALAPLRKMYEKSASTN